MKLIFSTYDLNVFHSKIVMSDILSFERDFYLGVFKNIDWPGQVVTATLIPNHPNATEDYLDWIEVPTMWRRNGYASQLINGIIKYTNRNIVMVGVTASGRGFQKGCKL